VATALVAGLLGLFGTFLGAALTTYTTRETSNRSERRAREEARRQEFRSAVIRFATNLLAYRLAEMDYWFAIHDGLKDRATTGEEVYRTRAVTWNAFYELEFSTDDQEVMRLARRGINSAHSIGEADSRDAMDHCAYETRNNLVRWPHTFTGC
jgi:hypothetical protein